MLRMEAAETAYQAALRHQDALGQGRGARIALERKRQAKTISEADYAALKELVDEGLFE